MEEEGEKVIHSRAVVRATECTADTHTSKCHLYTGFELWVPTLSFFLSFLSWLFSSLIFILFLLGVSLVAFELLGL